LPALHDTIEQDKKDISRETRPLDWRRPGPDICHDAERQIEEIKAN
jgi:hypothetical protein